MFELHQTPTRQMRFEVLYNFKCTKLKWKGSDSFWAMSLNINIYRKFNFLEFYDYDDGCGNWIFIFFFVVIFNDLWQKLQNHIERDCSLLLKMSTRYHRQVIKYSCYFQFQDRISERVSECGRERERLSNVLIYINHEQNIIRVNEP